MSLIKKILMFSGCIVTIMIVTVQPLFLFAREQDRSLPNNNYTGLSSDLKKIEDIADNVTVKIYKNSPNLPPGGSGFIIKKAPNTSGDRNYKYKYFVTTNRHVIESLKENIQIITPDNKHHAAKQYEISFKKPTDLGLLFFYSNNVYLEAKINTSYEFREKEILLVHGFPCTRESCKGSRSTIGRVGPIDSLLPNGNSLIDGYSLPYDFFSPEPEVGMSGSPVLNSQGEVVAVHGKGKYIQKNVQDTSRPYYSLENKENPNSQSQRFMYFFSWAIPLAKINNSDIPKNIVANVYGPNHIIKQSNPALSNSGPKINIFQSVDFIIICSILLSIFYLWRSLKYRQLIYKLSDLDNLPGCILTINTGIHQEKIARMIIEREADYIIIFKKESGNSYEKVQQIFEETIKKKCQGLRISKYESKVVDEDFKKNKKYSINQIMIKDRDLAKEFPKQNSIGAIQYSSSVNGKECKQKIYFISSLSNGAEFLAKSINFNCVDETHLPKISLAKIISVSF